MSMHAFTVVPMHSPTWRLTWEVHNVLASEPMHAQSTAALRNATDDYRLLGHVDALAVCSWGASLGAPSAGLDSKRNPKPAPDSKESNVMQQNGSHKRGHDCTLHQHDAIGSPLHKWSYRQHTPSASLYTFQEFTMITRAIKQHS